MVSESHVAVDELAQEILHFDQQCEHVNAEREAMRVALFTQGHHLENATNLFRSRIDGPTAKLRDKMRYMTRFNGTFKVDKGNCTRGWTASESGRQPWPTMAWRSFRAWTRRSGQK